MVGNTSYQRDVAPAVLGLAGLAISLVGIGCFASFLWIVGSIYIGPFMGHESTPEEQLIGYIAQAIDLIVVILALRAHVIAARYLVGRGEEPTAAAVATGAAPALLGWVLLLWSFGGQYQEIVSGLILLLPIALVAAWGYVALR